MEGPPHIHTPHASPALRHVRLSVTVCAWIVGLSLFVQIFTWALVNYTDLRVTKIQPTAAEYHPTVVKKTKPQRGEVHSLTGVEPRPAVEPEVVKNAPPPEVNESASRFNVWFRVQHQLALVVGIAGCLALCVQLAVGTVVASGASVYGIRGIVSAQAWSMALLALCLPWQRLAAEFPFGGVFTTYDVMTGASDAFTAGGPEALPSLLFYGKFFLLPVAALAATTIIGLRFAAGIETGIVSNGPTAEELAIEAEASNRKAGSLVGAGRIGGALENTLKKSAAVEPVKNPPDPFIPSRPRAEMVTNEPPSRRPI